MHARLGNQGKGREKIMSDFYTVTEDDVGYSNIVAFGRGWPTAEFLGRKVRAGDVGKRVYKTDSDRHDGYASLEIESATQRDARLADPAKNARELAAQVMKELVAMAARHNAELDEASARLHAAFTAPIAAGVPESELRPVLDQLGTREQREHRR
jgi:hypothetical protein